MKYTCPSCGYLVFVGAPGSDEICPICFWEDDLSQLRFAAITGANRISLMEAQQNYVRFGAIEKHLVSFVRKVEQNDKRDLQWRQLDLSLDKIEYPEDGKDYGSDYPLDGTELYYWRKK